MKDYLRGMNDLTRKAVVFLLVIAMLMPGFVPSQTEDANAETRLGAVNAKFRIYPNESEGGTLTGDNLKLDPPTDGEVSITFQIDLSTSGSDPAHPGELTLKIPRSVFQTHSTGQTEVAIPYPASGTGDWTYTMDNDYITLTNRVLIEPAHTQTMSFAYKVKHTSHIVDGSNVDFKAEVTLKKGSFTETNTSKSLNVQVDTHVRLANAAKSSGDIFTSWNSVWGEEPDLPGGIDNYFFTMWKLSAYLGWDSATQAYNLTYKEPDTLQDGGIVCGYMDWYNNNSGSGKRDDSITKKPLLPAPPAKTVMEPKSDVSIWYSGVLVAYPKPDREELPKNYRNSFTATITPYDGKDEPTSKTDDGVLTYKDMNLNIPEGEMYYLEKLKGWVANDALYRRLNGGIDRLRAGVPIDNIAYSIGGYAYQYTKEASDPTQIRSWGAQYTAELVDDMFFLNVNPDCRLGDGDYEITRLNPNWEAYEYQQNIGKGEYEEVEADFTKNGKEGAVGGNGYFADNYPELIAYGKTDNGSWQKIATFAVNTDGRPEVKAIHMDGASYYNSETHRGGVKISKGTGITQIKYSVTANKGKSVEDSQGVIRIRFERRSTPGGQYHSWDSTNKSEIYLTLYPTDKVKNEIQKVIDQNVASDPGPYTDESGNNHSHMNDGDLGEGDNFAPVAKLHNIDHLTVYTGTRSEENRLQDLKGADLPQGESDKNFENVLRDHDVTLYDRDMWHKKAQIELTPYLYDSMINKSSTYDNDPANNRVIVHYVSTMAEAVVTRDNDVAQDLIDRGIIRLQQSGTFYDLLPQGMTVDPDSIKATGCASDANYEVEYDMIRNYRDSGRTLLIVKVSTDVPNFKQANLWNKGFKIERDNSTLPHLESGFTINYDGYYDWDSLYDFGNIVTNYIGYESDNDSIENGVDDNPEEWQYTDFTPVKEYMKDLDETPHEVDEEGHEIPRPNFLYTNDSNTLTVVTQARYGLTKKITGPTVSGWVNGRVGEGEANQVGVPTGGQYSYRLRYAAEPRTTVKNMVLFDGLEAYSYIRDKKTESTDPTDDGKKSDKIDIDRDDYKVVTWHGTFESIDVSKIEAMGIKPVVYYTTKARDELQIDDQSDKSDTLTAQGDLAECWQVLPTDPDELEAIKKDITGIAIDMRKRKNGSDFELTSEKSVSAVVTMRAPEDPKYVRALIDQAKNQYDTIYQAVHDASYQTKYKELIAAERTEEEAKEEAEKWIKDKVDETTNDKPYAYNAVNMNSQVKETGSSEYSDPHLITYEYTRAHLYVPKGNLSITKKVIGLEDEEIGAYTFKVAASYKDADGSIVPFAGDYRKINTVTGYYFTDKDGVYVNMSGDYPNYVKYDSEAADGEGAWVNCDADGEPTDHAVEAPAESYTFKTEDGQETFDIKGNERIVLLDTVADLEWTVEETAAEGFKTTHTVNGKSGEDRYVTAPFVIGDRNTARIVYNNIATSVLVLKKNVDVGDKDKPFNFTIEITDEEGNEYTDYEGTPLTFEYEGEAEEGVEPPENGKIHNGDTVSLMHGQSIRIYVPGGAKYKITEEVPENYEDPEIERSYQLVKVEGEGEDAEVTTEDVNEESDGSGEIGEATTVKETFTNKHKPDEPPDKRVLGNDVMEVDGIETPVSEEIKDTTNEDLTHVDLGIYANPVTYSIYQEVPIETKKMVISDTLVDPLEFVSTPEDVTVLDGNGETFEAAVVEIEGKKLTVTIEDTEHEGIEKDVRSMVNGSVTVLFKAKLKEDADLAPYSETGTTIVPNTAKVKFNDRPEVETEPVTVTPPPPDEEVDKKVNGEEHYDLEAPEEVFNYTIDAVIPVDAEHVTITDTLEDVLEFDGDSSDVKVTYKGEDVEGAEITIADQKLTVELDGEAAAAQRTRTIQVSFSAKIKEGADLAPYAETGEVLVENKARLKVNNRDEIESEPVTVTPPPEEEIDKLVNGKERHDLEALEEEFTYTIDAVVPADATRVEVTDTLEDVLEFVGDSADVKVTYDDDEIDGTEVTIAGQKLTVELNGEAAKLQRTHTIRIEFRAKIKDGAYLVPYITDGEVQIPNVAKMVINNDASRTHETEPVIVVPPVDSSRPPIKKLVNEKKHEDLGAKREVFTYKISTLVPENAKAFAVTDKLEKVLEFYGDVSATIGEDVGVSQDQIKISGQKVTVTLTEEQLSEYGGEDLVIEFDARIRKGADLKKYTNKKGKVKVPNVAAYKLTDADGNEIDTESNVVTVTPPAEDSGGDDTDKGDDETDREITIHDVKTGDVGNMMLWIALLIACLYALKISGAFEKKNL